MDQFNNTLIHRDQGGAVETFEAGSSLIMKAGSTFAVGGATPVAYPIANVGQSAITDSSGGTASTTLAAITAGATYAQADMVAAKNAIASLSRQNEAMRAALVAAGIIKGSA